MSQKLEYRYWHPGLNSFIYSDNFYRTDIKGQASLERFTGLLDKKKNKIYENDIICALSSNNKYLSLVVWNEKDKEWNFNSIVNKNMKFDYKLCYGCSSWKIVGNATENPELLK